MKKNKTSLYRESFIPIRKYLRIMKLTFIFILLGLMSYASVTYSQSARLTFESKNATVESVFKQIEALTEYKFAYNSTKLDVDKKISLKVENQTIDAILNKILGSANFQYKIVDRYIIITDENLENTNSMGNITQQQKAVSGKVSDSSGGTLPGVSVVVKGTTTGTITDADGNYSLSNIPSDATLVFSFVGMKAQEMKIAGKTTLNVMLVDETVRIDEVVAVGYGVQKKRDITGSIASISKDNIEKSNVTSLDQVLQGKAAGVMVTQSSGQPGAPPAVQIRGAGRFGSTEPLYIIDNVIIQGNGDRQQGQSGGSSNPLSGINTSDIQSIEVLKDAGAAAIYGARAGNGVVIITTKKGVQGKMQISFDSYMGTQSLQKKLDMLNSNQFFDYFKESTLNVHPKDTPENRAINTDWQNYIFKNAPIQNYSLNISGGNESTTYSISGGYLKQDGIMLASGFERYTLRSNNDFKISKHIKVGLSLNLSRTSQQVNDDNGFHYSYLQKALEMPPYITPYSIDPKFTDGYNGPVNDDKVQLPSVFNVLFNDLNDQSNRLISDVYAQIDILKGLTYKFNLGLDLGAGLSDQRTPIHYNGDYQSSDVATLSQNTRFSKGILIENTLNYLKEIDKHNFNVVIGVSQQKNSSNFYYMSTTLDNNIQRSFDAGSNGNITMGGNSSEYLMRSQFGRMSYNYDGKYLFSATIRRDGSSRFGPDNRWGIFPAFSLGWRIKNENFLSNVSLISDLKIFGSWGRLGNDVIGNYQYANNVVGSYTDGNGTNLIVYPFGGSSDILYGGKVPVQAGNDKLRWESTQSTNVGFTGSLFQNRVTFEAEYYAKKTNDLLIASIPVPNSVGVKGPASNAASILNKGMDYSLGYRGNVGEFKYSLVGNLSLYLENKVLSLGAIPSPIYGGNNATDTNSTYVTKTEVGGPVGAFYGYKMVGIWQEGESSLMNQQQPGAVAGDIRYAVGKDGNPMQQQIGNPNPDYSFGLTLSGEYKGFDFSVFFQGVQGNDVYNAVASKVGLAGGSAYYNSTTRMLNAWTPENKSNTQPRALYSSSNYQVSSYFVEDGSYVRIKNLQLGYSLPQYLLKNLKISKLRLYISANNLHTFTKYSGYDPELGGYSGKNTDRGIDILSYPGSRDFMVGVQLGF
jgi:TonB-linked SusC/RagA family outer membrane protein